MLPPDAIALLARHPTFASLGAAALAALAEQLVWLGLPGGRPLYKVGEPADALYLLCRGSLGVFEGPTGLRHLIAAGDCVGELSLLSGETRLRTVRALRDCELLRLDRAAFEALIGAHPHAMLDLTRFALQRLQRRQHGEERPGLPRTFAILPVDGTLPVRALAMQLAMALGTYGRCLVIDAALGQARSADWFAERAAQADFVLYLDCGDAPEWRQRCLRQADVLLLPAAAAQPARPWPVQAPTDPAVARHRPRHLLLLHAGRQIALGAAQRWRTMFRGELEHHHICQQEDLARLARLISGRGRGLVLAGGGARGMAHLGALRALHEAGHRFDAVGGTSIGAIIGAALANGGDSATIEALCRRSFVQGRPLADWTVPLVALSRGRRASVLLRQAFGALAIEDLARPFFCVSTSLSGGGCTVHRHGPLWLWLRASSAIPGVLPPVLQHGGVYVDGALVNNLPTDVMDSAGIAHITALDIRADIHLRSDTDETFTPPLWRLLWQRRRAIQRPGLLSTLVRAAMVNGEDASSARRRRADLLITPPLDHIGMLDWKDCQRAIEAGYRHTAQVLEHGTPAGE
jgi:NTE family protein